MPYIQFFQLNVRISYSARYCGKVQRFLLNMRISSSLRDEGSLHFHPSNRYID